MPWPALIVPTPGTVITAAWASSQVVDPLAWLRAMTGGADPPAAAYVVVSTGPGSTSWGKVTGDVIAANTIGGGHLQLGAPNAAIAFPLVIPKLNDGGQGGQLQLQASAGQRGAAIDVANNIMRLYDPASGAVPIAADLTTGAVTLLNTLTLTQLNATTTGRIIAAATGSTAAYTIDAASSTFRVYNPADPTRMLQFHLGSGATTLPSTLTLAALDASTTGRIVGNAPASAAGYAIDAAGSSFRVYNPADPTKMLSFNLTNNALLLGTAAAITSANIGAQSVAFAANAGTLGNIPAATSPTPNRVPVSDASGRLDAWVTPTSAAPVPSGLIAFIADANVPSGWAFYTAANGRVIVAAGSAGVTNNQTFAVGNSYGPDWGHGHTVNVQHAHGHGTTHAHGATALGVGGTINASTDVNGLAAAGGVNLNTTGHTHPHSLDVTGTTDGAPPGSTDNAGSTTQATSGVIWIPPSHALNAIRKT